MAAKIVLITGLGYETVKALLQSDASYHVLLSGRDFTKTQQASLAVAEEVPGSKSTIEAVQLDVESDASITEAFESVSKNHAQIDILINNAGATYDPHGFDGRMTTREAWNRTWNVNVTSAHLVTIAFLPLLLQSRADPRLIFVASGASSLKDSTDPSFAFNEVPPAGLPKPPNPMAYKTSKTGLNMLMAEWSRMLRKDMVKVFCVSPGCKPTISVHEKLYENTNRPTVLATNLGGDPEMLKQRGAAPPSAGGVSIRNVIEGGFDEHAGKVVRGYNSPVQPW
nr:short-chain dehydrogenase/reductase trope [Quercus suber]